MPRSNGSGIVYTSIPDEEGKSSGEMARNRPSNARRGLSWTLNTVVILLAAYGLVTLAGRLVPARIPSCNCGETVEEARSRGCVYDSLAAAWLPPHCRSAAITAEFEAAGPNEPDRWGNTWGYWADKNKTQPLTLEEVSMLPESARRGGPAHFFTTHEWHVMHCVYYWRKMWESGRRARGFAGSDGKGELVIEKRYDTLMHIEHCMTMLTKQDTPPDSIAAEAGVALHSDEIHIAKPHKHQNDGDPYDKMGDEEEHKHHHGDPYGEKEDGSKDAANRR
ncbi:hypothetical protein DL768_007589 [Monosporascus sp. mg162]|nr:hypothetical protein DL768_007589 [Monosporascus sp. mg162]